MSDTRKIHQVPRREILRHKWGNTADIMREIVAVCSDETLVEQVREFAQQYRGNDPDSQYKGLQKLWEFARFQIDYEIDPEGWQFIKHPGRVWWDNKNGDGSDCKSLAIFVYFCCRAIGVPCFIRFASYDADREIKHVYPVALLPEFGEVPLDAVYTSFDAEQGGMTNQIDRKPKGWNSPNIGKLATDKATMPTETASVVSTWSEKWKALEPWKKAAAIIGGIFLLNEATK
jgi:hypothetical protein